MIDNRLDIVLLHRTAETFVRFVDVASLLSFLTRTGRATSYQICARKGKQAIFIEKIETPAQLTKELNEFQTKVG